ncbi:hypothetical protein FNW52_11055 [Flavobacterium sp. ZT3R18]|uniref:hypothetical protein n=1 Tax=Flavobacterium sp. ZT3R18 TaxID=2594429 RepID=UPI00117AA8E2|nr:hypothetical protein [Flavobacterium sp. ZT3R18]TRX35569.1 hypothetical protein FNW52_11055 [Flavobacterium sp. ZT3R18]
MKFKFLFLLVFVSSYSFSQSINDYVAVIVPVKYEFLKSENQYRLNTLTKFNLKKSGFEAFYANEIMPKEYNDRCSLLYVDVNEDNGFMITKLYVTFKDCYGTVIYKSEVGKSREKEFDVAYVEALNNAFISIYALHYKYSGAVTNSQKTAITPVALPAVVATTVAVNLPSSTETNEMNVLFAQPIKNGFQLVDNTPKVIMKVYKTTNPAIYLATKETVQGVLISKDSQWFFEYYEKETLMSEKIAVKF